VSQEEIPGTPRLGRRREQGIALRPRGRFEAIPLRLGPRGHIPVQHLYGNIQRLTEPLAPPGIAVGFRAAEVMIHMQRADLPLAAAFPPECHGRSQQGHAVRPARERNRHMHVPPKLRRHVFREILQQAFEFCRQRAAFSWGGFSTRHSP
jgi:hypothetical protein